MQILLVDDHPLFRQALRQILGANMPSVRIDEAESIEVAQSILNRDSRFDLIVLDLNMRGLSGFDGLLALRIGFPHIPILVVSGLEESRIIREALNLGAAGFVPKSSAKSAYLDAITRIMDGELYVPTLADEPQPTASKAETASARIATLTPAQIKVLSMIKLGKVNKQIAYELGIGDSMVKAHVSEIMRKLDVKNRTQAALCASALDYNRAGREHFPVGTGRRPALHEEPCA